MPGSSSTVAGEPFSETADAGSSSLLDRMGGVATLGRMVDRFVERLLTDPDLTTRFGGVDIAALKQTQMAFFIEAFGGGSSPAASECLVHLDSEQFLRVVIHLQHALATLGHSDELTGQLERAVIECAMFEL